MKKNNYTAPELYIYRELEMSVDGFLASGGRFTVVDDASIGYFFNEDEFTEEEYD